MKTIILLALGTFLLTTNSFSQDPNFYIYLCFGQSNMEGQGPIQTQDETVDGRFKVFQALDCPGLSRTKAAWYPATPPLCQCNTGLSPADYFGRTMVENLPDSITIGVINVSVAGCDIRLFDKDIYQDYDDTYSDSWFHDRINDYGGNPYMHLIDLAKLAKQDGVIKGILLHQGEANNGDDEWPGYVEKIYNDMLTDLSLNADMVPLLAGEVLSAPGNCCAGMNAIINLLPETIPTAYVVSADGCPGKDNAHFSSEGYRILGRRYAEKMLSVMVLETVYMEPECGTVGENWRILPDTKASNGSYVTATPGMENISNPPTGDLSVIKMNFNVTANGSYYLYGRLNDPGSKDDSYWIKIDNNAFELINDLTTSGWEWLELKNFDLTAGDHSVSIAFGEDGAKLDKLAIRNAQISPVDKGGQANNICEPDFYTGKTDIAREAEGFLLEQNYPNPFTQQTNISFQIPIRTYVSLKVTDIRGVEISELAGKEFGQGKHIIEFSTAKLPAGNYFYTIKADKFSVTRKMIITGK